MDAKADNSVQITQFQKKYKKIKLSITVKNFSTGETFKVLTNGKNRLSSHYIIFDPSKRFDVRKITDEYYCNTLKDLNDIISYICEHHNDYVYSKNTDVLDLSSRNIK